MHAPANAGVQSAPTASFAPVATGDDRRPRDIQTWRHSTRRRRVGSQRASRPGDLANFSERASPVNHQHRQPEHQTTSAAGSPTSSLEHQVEPPLLVLGDPQALESVVRQLITETGLVEVRFERPNHSRTSSGHPLDQILGVIDGMMTISYVGGQLRARAGHLVLLPSRTQYMAEAGPCGCTVVVAYRASEPSRRAAVA